MSFESSRTGTPDGSAGIPVATRSSQAAAATKIPIGIAASDLIGNTPTAHRASTSSVDADTDMSSAGFGASGLKLSDNRGAIAIWAAFTTAGASCTLRPIFYDNAATPAPQAVGPALTLTATARRLSAAGDYLSEVLLLDSYGFAAFKLFIETLSAGNVTIYGEPV